MSSKPPVFLLNRDNERFLLGRIPAPVDAPPTRRPLWKSIVLFLLSAAVIYWMIEAVNQAAGWPVVAGGLLFLSLAAYWAAMPLLDNRIAQPRYHRLDGELTGCERITHNGAANWRITYRFLNPRGRWMDGVYSTERTPTRADSRPDPQPGTRLAIAYLNDHKHRVL